MVAAIVVDKNKVVCVTAEPKKDGTYTTVAEASSPFNGFLRGESLSAQNRQTTFTQMMEIALETAE